MLDVSIHRQIVWTIFDCSKFYHTCTLAMFWTKGPTLVPRLIVSFLAHEEHGNEAFWLHNGQVSFPGSSRRAWEWGYFFKHTVLDTYYKQTCIHTHLYVLLMFVHCSENLFMNTHILHVFVCLLNLECIYHVFSTAQMRGVHSVVSGCLRFSLECLNCVTTTPSWRWYMGEWRRRTCD